MYNQTHTRPSVTSVTSVMRQACLFESVHAVTTCIIKLFTVEHAQTKTKNLFTIFNEFVYFKRRLCHCSDVELE